MSFLVENRPLLLVYKNMESPSLEKKVNIVLTPEFYTLKREELPFKYAFQAKKIAKSLFDGLLEKSKSYEYMVYKEGDEWIFIAYDIEMIERFLVEKGISIEQIGKIFFAQQFLLELQSPLKLGDKDALVALDNTVVILPQSMVEQKSSKSTLNDNFTPARGVAFKSTIHSFLTRKQTIALSSIFASFAILLFVEGWHYNSESEDIREEIINLVDDYPALQSQYTRMSVLKKYKDIDSKERRKRDIIKTLGGLIFTGVSVESFSMDNKKFSVRFLCNDAKVARRFRENAKKVGFTSAKTLTNNFVTIEEKL